MKSVITKDLWSSFSISEQIKQIFLLWKIKVAGIKITNAIALD
ncbi:hypothetical protein [Halotia branconii]|uniref:Uncharacterized protein n=1 Tax=Halotia branconii CENA392 TaxID=1539056 RepID=A0AAJ6NTG4_9CYAN|nr:hypothetical protein [Halotia branconii]WGV26211.1 hypothetical protein QI031_01465 [Halotia branconii CENA392]